MSTEKPIPSDLRQGLVMLRRRDVERRTGLSKSQIYRMTKERNFPQPFQVSSGVVAWREDEIDQWISGLRRAAI